MLHTLLVVLAVLAATLVASGCGGSTKSTSQTQSVAQSATTQAATTTQATTPTSTESSTSTAPLTKAELIAKADAICSRVNAKRATLTVTPKTPAAEIYARLTPVSIYEASALEELTKLTPPASLAYDWRQILDNTRTINETTAELGNDSKTGKLNGEQRPLLILAANAERQVITIATHDGFKQCSQT